VLNGEMFIGGAAVKGRAEAVRGIDPTTGEALDPPYGGAGSAELERACALAEAAFDTYRETTSRLLGKAVASDHAWQRLAELGDTFGHRISGSQALTVLAISWPNSWR